MKKIFFLILIFTGELAFGETINVGPQFSATSTSLDATSGFTNQVSGVGYGLGAFMRAKILFLYGQAELSYSTKSSSATTNLNGINTNITFLLNGIDFTAIAGAKLFGIGDAGNFRIFAGYGFNNFLNITYSLNGVELSANQVNNLNNNLLAGAGVDLARFTLDLRYIQGLTDISQSSLQQIETRVVCLSFGYKLFK